MIALLLAISFAAFACETHFAKEKGRITRAWVIVPSATLGGLLSIAVLFTVGTGILNEVVGRPGSSHFRIGKLVPIPSHLGDYPIQFYLKYTERSWWGKGKPESWRARWNEGEGEYEYLDGKTWRPLPINFSRQDDREFGSDNRGNYEIR